MTRWILLSLLACTLCAATPTRADPPSRADTDAAIRSQLNAMLKRVEAVEERLSKLEDIERRSNAWWVDENGVMRLPSGQPIGFWGIDVPRAMEAR